MGVFQKPKLDIPTPGNSHSKSHFAIKGEADFEQFYHKSADKLFHIALKITGEREKAEGIVHDFFGDLWERRHTLKVRVPLETYAVRAIKFSSFDYLKEKVQKERGNKELQMTEARFHSNIEEELAASELKDTLAKLLNILPSRCQEVFRMRREKEMSNKEIAARLRISEKTVERHMTRALHLLRTGLK